MSLIQQPTWGFEPPTETPDYHTPTLEELSNELIDKIFSFITDKRDLYRLMMTSKHCRDHVLPVLYQSLSIAIGIKLDEKLKKLATGHNVGLCYTREVVAYPDATYFDDPERAQDQLDNIINHFTPNSLTPFCWKVPYSLLPCLSQTLWQQQRNLQRLEIIPLRSSGMRGAGRDIDLYAEMKDAKFTSLQAVRAVVATVDDVRLASVALRCGKVSTLEVDARIWSGRRRTRNRADRPGRVVERRAGPAD
ncbi:uncharacterized protein LTR77_008244 [Saxophila tyrrhenica]|uniref:F-box domain-containing protein n=1 Tax=Saxophila tyrrhenica TaxID=1690608 RepID=A0AAV9P285_9PEZI|nr:hypothetical protein LTR77_008244 [Saxophila tyrrhenica]